MRDKGSFGYGFFLVEVWFFFVVIVLVVLRIEQSHRQVCTLRLARATTLADSTAIYDENMRWYEEPCHRDNKE